jgi:hypothetical protein
VTADDDANKIRDTEIKRLIESANLAYSNMLDPALPMKMRETWHRQFTNTVLALNQLLKDSQYKHYEERMRAIENQEKGEN